ncbi:aqualysin-1-like [Saccoglossus kowalevskii]|uniref:Cuticle-degrading serine protease-like n=1 Tax=Saccoglossus kowalevskii TaxID=10224 RepID=A0ABM0MZ75_SACKO|nr:PREDICTED: cuticle-degrading serine protease-like [Saccoglossus kowalevskii]
MRIFVLFVVVAVANAAYLVPLLKNSEPIKNSYILKVKDSVDLDDVAPKLAKLRIEVQWKYVTLKGFAVRAQETDLHALRTMSEFEYIEEDGVVRANIEWGCDRIDQRDLPLDDIMNLYHDGSGAHVYIIDTGLRHSHVEFEPNRASFHFDYETRGDVPPGDDCNGHGTHCGGSAAGVTVGIGTSARLYSVRVLNCMGAGSWANCIAGCDSVTATGTRPGVSSLSLGGGAHQGMDDAVTRMIQAGFVVSIAAGNDNHDACLNSPARVEEAITVGATDDTDTRASFSNYGPCVDIFAPGVSVRSSYHLSDTSYATLSGTSMACPHVTGVSAVHLGANTCFNNTDCKAKILAEASVDKVIDHQSPDNLLLYCD